MRCDRCLRENPPKSRFCLECGFRLASRCANCDHPLSDDAKFCNECGRPVVTDLSIRRTAAEPTQYTPKHLAERILTSRGAMEGERKQVTVLFADLKGSMELLADRDPEEARALIDPVIERMMEAVHKYEGTVNQIMGDGIMALFGAPIAHEDHAVRACYAALRMQESISRYGDDMQRRHGIPIQLRVGLNSGDVVVRSIGNDLRMDYSAVGQTTHLAARMEQMAKPGTVLLTPGTLSLAEGYVVVKPLGPVNVKGLSDPIDVFELNGVSAARTRLQAAASRGLTRFVGRQRELEVLTEALTQASEGKGQVVAVVGEPGVGKSRLFHEFTRSHRTQGALIIHAGSVSYGKATPYLPVIDMLRSYFKVEDRDDPRTVREKVTGKLLTLDENMRPALPALAALLGAADDDPGWRALDPSQRRQLILNSIRHFLLRESQLQPVLLVFEDLHWIDSETQVLLDSLIESLPATRILLLVNYRPEYQDTWSKSYYTRLRLDTLARVNASELLDALVGTNPGFTALREMLVKSTEGNPFFLEESVRTLVETKMLIGHPGAYELVGSIANVRIPSTVQSILAARIDRLPPEEKQLLQAASVVGKDVPLALLQAVAEMPEGELHGALAHLQGTEFLYEAQLFPDIHLSFKHALTHEVTYGSLVSERRRALHLKILAAMEGHYCDRLSEHVEQLAHHAVRGEDWARALSYLRQAGARAVERSGNREAVRYFEQALASIARLPESQDLDAQAIDLNLELRSVLTALGDLDRGLERLNDARALSERIGDHHRLGWTLGCLTDCYRQRGQYDKAIDAGRHALSAAEANDDREVHILATHYLAGTYTYTGEYEQAANFARQTLESLADERPWTLLGQPGLPTSQARTWLAASLAELGRFSEASICAHEALRIAEEARHPYSQVVAAEGAGYSHLRQGDLTHAIRVLERGVAICEATETAYLSPFVTSLLGSAYCLSGRVSEGLPLLERAVDTAEVMRIMIIRSMLVSALADGYLLAGKPLKAIDLAERALDLAREHGERGYEAWTLKLLGDIEAHTDRDESERAEDFYRQASTLSDRLEMRPLTAHCHFSLARLYRRTTRLQEGADLLDDAMARYRTLGMPYWLQRAEAARVAH